MTVEIKLPQLDQGVSHTAANTQDLTRTAPAPHSHYFSVSNTLFFNRIGLIMSFAAIAKNRLERDEFRIPSRIRNELQDFRKLKCNARAFCNLVDCDQSSVALGYCCDN